MRGVGESRRRAYRRQLDFGLDAGVEGELLRGFLRMRASGNHRWGSVPYTKSEKEGRRIQGRKRVRVRTLYPSVTKYCMTSRSISVFDTCDASFLKL